MASTQLSIIILAAGKGSRMKSDMAKVLHKISGKPMLYHIIKEALTLSDDVSVVVAHQSERVIEEMCKYYDNVSFVEQNIDEHPGTGGALFNADPKHEKILVLNGDMPLISAESLQGFLNIDADIVLSVFDLQDPSGYGRVCIEEDEVQYIVEEKDATEEELAITYVNAGVYAFTKKTLETYLPRLNNDNAQKEFYLTDVIALAREDALSIKPLLVEEGYFKGVNSKYDLANAEVIMQERMKKEWMKTGVIMQLSDTIYIEEGVVFEGECIIENGVKITAPSTIKASHIKSHSVVEESVIENSSVGPMAHVRPKSMLIDSHIGNFVEVKKSILKGVKAGHLSYLGDSEIDEGTNIGAGTITCNYDGIAKYKTKIGKNVFVGSDTQIIAPCEIEDDVIIGAGTTLKSEFVKKGSLAISRPPLKFIENFYYKFFGKK